MPSYTHTLVQFNNNLMIIRKATKKDLKELSILFDNYRVFYEKESDLKSAQLFLLKRIENKESEIFIAENNEENLVGFVQLYPIFSSTKMQRLWLLNDLFVEKDYRGKGISVLLINESKKLCKETNACGIILETAKTNDIGNNLYPKTEFLLDKEHNYYSWNNK